MRDVVFKNSPLLLIKWLSIEKKSVYKIYILAALQGIMFLVIPLSVQGIITYIMAGKFSASLIVLSLLTISATFFIGVLQLWQMRINETLQEKIFVKVADKISSYFSMGVTVDLKFKINQFFETITLQKGITKLLLDFTFSIISIILGLLILPAYNSWFLLFSVLLAVSFYFIVSYYGKKALENNLRTSSQKYVLFDWFKDLAHGAGDVHNVNSKSDKLLSEYIVYRKRYYSTLELQFKGVLIFKLFFISILLFLGVYLVQIGEINIGQFVASEIIILLVINSVEKLIVSIDTCYDVITALYKLEDIFSAAPKNSYLNNNQNNQYSLKAITKIYSHPYPKRIKFLFYTLIISVIVVLFLPWTQSVDAYGYVTALNPQNKPQNLTSRIAGRIEKWYISDGDFVKKNDTIAFISEIKDEYIDPKLIERSASQVKSKEISLQSYENKINAINQQIDALNSSLRLKSEQIKNKITQAKLKLNSDSIDNNAAINNYKIAEEQFKRYEDLLVKGVISKTDFENRKVKLQEALAKKNTSENKVISAKNEILNAEIELNSIEQDYNEKFMKCESDKYSTMSLFYDAEGSLTKLQNQLSNYALRKSYYFVLAPQDGYIHKINVKGIGEIIKEGGVLCNIVPVQNEQVVEIFVNPIDMPLIKRGLNVQLIFDGWPVFVFSGWPGLSYGTYSAEIIAFDRVISDNGKFRVLAVNKDRKWPSEIQIGGGVKGFALLKNVPLIYEFWRQVNGFPPEYYSNSKEKTESVKK